MTIARVLLILLRVGAGVQVVGGIALWSGHGYQFVALHRSIGVLFVLVFWALAGFALSRRAQRVLSLFAIAWGAVIVALGFAQQALLPGDLHWIIRLLHLLVGLSAMPIAERLGRGGTIVCPRLDAVR